MVLTMIRTVIEVSCSFEYGEEPGSRNFFLIGLFVFIQVAMLFSLFVIAFGMAFFILLDVNVVRRHVSH